MQGLTFLSMLVQIKGNSGLCVCGGGLPGALTNHLQALFGVLGIDAVELLFEFHDLLRLNGDVCGLALGDVPRREGWNQCQPLMGRPEMGTWEPPLDFGVFRQVGQGFASPSTSCFILTTIRKASWIKYIFLFSVSGPR